MDVVVVYSSDVRIRDDNEREVAKGMDTVSKASREEGEREVCRGEKVGF